MNEWIVQLFQNKDLLRMGHCQQLEDLNLGMGWLYYGLTRLIRPQKVVVIGSWRGFAPLIFSKALADNAEKGVVYFIDPSLADDFWNDRNRVQDHFQRYGVNNIQHFLMTTQEFVESDEYNALNDPGIVFIDGLHTEDQARFDFEAFENKIAENGIFFFHDSLSTVKIKCQDLYSPKLHYERRVKYFIDTLKVNTQWQVFDFPFANGLTLVRKLSPTVVP
jgi:predicted O-methyltransferase YrrM